MTCPTSTGVPSSLVMNLAGSSTRVTTSFSSKAMRRAPTLMAAVCVTVPSRMSDSLVVPPPMSMFSTAAPADLDRSTAPQP